MCSAAGRQRLCTASHAECNCARVVRMPRSVRNALQSLADRPELGGHLLLSEFAQLVSPAQPVAEVARNLPGVPPATEASATALVRLRSAEERRRREIAEAAHKAMDAAPVRWRAVRTGKPPPPGARLL
eukprot:SAG11_NODE_10597_length_818_cov_1.210014_1_plen_129_part_00